MRTSVDPPSTVDLLQPDDAARWDAFVLAHPDGTIYHTLAWKAVTEEGLRHQPYYLRAVDADGAIAGVLPLFLVKGIFGRRLVSVPMRDRAGVLARDARTASALLSRAIDLSRELNCKYLELRSLEGMDADVVREQGLRCERYWITTRIDLSPGTQQLWKRLDRDAVRWAINNARKRGVRVELDDTEKGMNTFYELFVRTRRSMGIPPFPKSLFLAIWRHLISRGAANLLLVWNGSVPIGGLISVLSNDSFVPAYAAPQKSWRKHYPSEVVFWHAIEWASEHGYHYFDFGADSPLQTGLLWFKKKWGGVQQPMFYYYHPSGGSSAAANYDSSSPVYTFARKTWAVLPVPVCKVLGGWVTRQLS